MHSCMYPIRFTRTILASSIYYHGYGATLNTCGSNRKLVHSFSEAVDADIDAADCNQTPPDVPPPVESAPPGHLKIRRPLFPSFESLRDSETNDEEAQQEESARPLFRAIKRLRTSKTNDEKAQKEGSTSLAPPKTNDEEARKEGSARLVLSKINDEKAQQEESARPLFRAIRRLRISKIIDEKAQKEGSAELVLPKINDEEARKEGSAELVLPKINDEEVQKERSVKLVLPKTNDEKAQQEGSLRLVLPFIKRLKLSNTNDEETEQKQLPFSPIRRLSISKTNDGKAQQEDRQVPEATPRYIRRSHPRSQLTASPLIGSNARKRRTPSGAAILSGWLDRNIRGAEWDKSQYAIETPEETVWPISGTLPAILIDYLYRIKIARISPTRDLAVPLDLDDVQTIENRGFKPADVAAWAYILYTPDSEVTAQRFLSHGQTVPSFLLVETLRRQDISSKSVKSLLMYCWNIVMKQPQPDFLALTESDSERYVMPSAYALRKWRSRLNITKETTFLEELAFTVMAKRLLAHARRTWPTAVVSIAKMVIVYLDLIRERADALGTVDVKLQNRLTKMYNSFIVDLALPSKGFPMKSMHFNWQAQRALLERAATFNPPLEIDQNSYRAVMSVLNGTRKSQNEANYSRNMVRSWPPWRDEQDGIDAARPREVDISRTTGAIWQMKTVGYVQQKIDNAIGIVGGREPDGTPTIQHRHVFSRRLRNNHVERDIYMWVARIRATRDVKEAWSAFLSFEEESPKGSLQTYYAMFEKLIYDKLRHIRRVPFKGLPGDGMEVLEVSDENLTADERIRLSPPDIDQLYERMINHGIIPQGNCLKFLISHARTLEHGIRYLRDSDLSPKSKEALTTNDSSVRQEYLTNVPDEVFLAFITLLCRFAYTTKNSPDPELIESENHDTSTSSHFYDEKIGHPLLQAVTLLSERKPKTRPPWYKLFSTLAKEGLMVKLWDVEQPENDILSWKILTAALRDSQKAGVELDSKGYHIMCVAFHKALLASYRLDEEKTTELNNGPSLLKELFASIKEDSPADNDVPRLLHVVEAVATHAHIRVMGELGDREEIINVVRWMVDNQDELESIDVMSSNGRNMRRRCLIAARYYIAGDEEAEEQVRDLVDSVEIWDGWASDEEVEEYQDFRTSNGENQKPLDRSILGG